MIFRTPDLAPKDCVQCHGTFETRYPAKSYCDPCIQRMKRQVSNAIRSAYRKTHQIPSDMASHRLLEPIRAKINDHRFVVLVGRPGSGKTTQAHQALATYDQKRSDGVAFVYASELGQLSIEDGWGPLNAKGMIAVDDVGAKMTPGAVDALCRIIDTRGGRPLIITTNEKQVDIAARDERLGSRVRRAEWVIMPDVDHRQ